MFFVNFFFFDFIWSDGWPLERESEELFRIIILIVQIFTYDCIWVVHWHVQIRTRSNFIKWTVAKKGGQTMCTICFQWTNPTLDTIFKFAKWRWRKRCEIHEKGEAYGRVFIFTKIKQYFFRIDSRHSAFAILNSHFRFLQIFLKSMSVIIA